MMHFLADWKFDPVKELGDHGWRGVHRLPFVFVFGRSNFTVSYFGAQRLSREHQRRPEQPEVRDL